MRIAKQPAQRTGLAIEKVGLVAMASPLGGLVQQVWLRLAVRSKEEGLHAEAEAQGGDNHNHCKALPCEIERSATI